MRINGAGEAGAPEEGRGRREAANPGKRGLRGWSDPDENTVVMGDVSTVGLLIGRRWSGYLNGAVRMPDPGETCRHSSECTFFLAAMKHTEKSSFSTLSPFAHCILTSKPTPFFNI